MGCETPPQAQRHKATHNRTLQTADVVGPMEWLPWLEFYLRWGSVGELVELNARGGVLGFKAQVFKY